MAALAAHGDLETVGRGHHRAGADAERPGFQARPVVHAEYGFDGTVYFCFQPAEEGGAGGRAMIQDGLFDRFPCEA
ncbi:M20/M25/M40 family metallo-hydrolase, partial [Xylella fastidiosa]|uniref:M20/M25/M40 family metallo-hydrolase n=1 Tax=Xylella fastidiosa TaxID=2371 RepID=UPI002F25EEF6